MKIPSEEQTEKLKSLLSIAQTSIVVLGVLVVFFYCATENITPDGLSLGDAFFLIWIALGFGFMLVLGTLLGVTVVQIPTNWFLTFINRLNKGRTSHQLHSFFQDPFLRMGSFFSLLGIALGSVLAVMTKTTFDWGLIRAAGFFCIYGFVLLVWCFVSNTKRPTLPVYNGLRLLTVSILAFCFSFAIVRPELLNYTMERMGLRSESGALLVISSADHDRLDELAKQGGISIEFCKLPRSSSWGTLDVRVIWHGIGTTSYVKLLAPNTDGRRNLLVPIPRENLVIIRPRMISLVCKDGREFNPR